MKFRNVLSFTAISKIGDDRAKKGESINHQGVHSSELLTEITSRHMHGSRAMCRHDGKKHDESEETDREEEIENVRVKECSEASGPRPINMVRRAK